MDDTIHEPGTVLCRVGKTEGGSVSVRIVGGPLVRQAGDGVFLFPAGWTVALVKATSDATRLTLYQLEPDSTGCETIEHLDCWVKGAFRVAYTITNGPAAKRVWNAMGRQDG